MDVLLNLTPDSEADAADSDRLTARLRAELRTLDLHTLRVPPEGAPPGGAKAVDPVTVGAVVLGLSAPSGILTSLVGLLQDWLGRQSARHRVSITIDGDTLVLEKASPEERRQLIAAFVRRHAAGGE
ncbi:hypothetical protein GA0115240_138553 [Streptomyces sp. DvalAA-14]|uniref:effector-associated constant component EACC1 n=1 Tax=unclassified Streptomyces TaxID=2593676 RepID=UPI00081B8564|nr:MULTISPECIES: hypothetical protein [unclassified Streptomyces]MYS22176.1 hypothetical protein [Streptomyces sp. SID4948]SCE10220.1 hypothetical protein GA0115240_138553 [Streptomyces sp. DvalAA-14]